MAAEKTGMNADTAEDQKLPTPGERFILLLPKAAPDAANGVPSGRHFKMSSL